MGSSLGLWNMSLFLSFLRGTEAQINIMTNFRSHSKLAAESESELKFPGAQPFFSHLSMVRIWEVARGKAMCPYVF